MARFTKLVETLSESFRRSGARSLSYFHTDHYEPWRSMSGRIDVSAPNGEDIVDFLEQTAKLDYARRLTLFLKPAFRLAPAGADVRSVEGDGLGFRPLTPRETEIHDAALAEIGRSGHELQVHIHHEYCTKNKMYSTQAQHNRDEFQRRYLAELTTPKQDEDRLKLLTQMTLELYHQGSGRDFSRWFFVHGMWALNGSDRDVCMIDREIGVLQSLGCQGDFTFPAGRSHTDPIHEAPFFCRSVDKAKCYDLAESEPAFAYGAPADGRFFIWASPIKHKYSSIDYYSREIRASLEDIDKAALELAQTSVFLDGRLYLKTHSHSMNSDYFDNIRRPIYPHFHPGVQALLGVIFDAASDAGMDVEFATASEIYDRFVNARFSGPTDLSSDEHTVRRRESASETVNAMTPLERLDTFGHLAASVTHEVVGKRLQDMGDTDSGAYGYYSDLFERETLIHPYEFAVARHLASTLPDGARVHEFGTGFASLGLLLAVAGYDVIGIDADPRRLATASAIRTELSRQVPWVAGRLSFKDAAIPAVLEKLDCNGVTAVATDVTSGTSLADLAAVVAAVGARYRKVVFDVERFFTRTRSAEEQASVRDLFLRHYDLCEPITDASVGRFYFEAKPADGVVAARPQVATAPAPAAPPPQPAVTLARGARPKSFLPLRLEDAAALLNKVGVAVLKERIDVFGLEGSGAGVFYGALVERGLLAQPYDLALARWLLDEVSPETPLLEVGPGVGALSLLLALAGRHIVALDLDPRRVVLASLIKRGLVDHLGCDLVYPRFIEAKFPVDPPPVPEAASVAVITNLVFGWSETEQRAMLEELAKFQRAVVDADRFGVRRATEDERDGFDLLAREVGLAVKPLNLVPDVRFVELMRLDVARAARRAPAESTSAPA